MAADPTTSTAIRVIEAVLPGAIGAAISLRFMEGQWWNKMLSFASGVAFSYYIGNGMIEYLGIVGKFTSTAILFTIGVFGLSIVNQLQQQIPDALRAARKRWIGE